MSWQNLKTNYTDASWSGLKKFKEIQNDDGTVSFQDETQYTNEENSFFGAKEANRMNEAMNLIMAKVEGGTDLYTDFLAYFNDQKERFESKSNSEFALFQKFINGLKESVQTKTTGFNDHVESLKTECDDSLSSTKRLFTQKMQTLENEQINYLLSVKSSGNDSLQKINQYIISLKQKGDSDLDAIENGYSDRMSSYESQKKNEFDGWFSDLKNQLSENVSGSLQNQINDLKATHQNDKTATLKEVEDTKKWAKNKINSFVAKQVIFSGNGIITEISEGEKITTEFLPTGEIVQKFYESEVLTITKTTTFNENSIKEVIS